MRQQIKVALHYTITSAISDTQIIHQLLSQLGIKLMMNWSRSHPGYEGEKLRVYSLDSEHWERVWTILQRRQTKRESLQRQHLDLVLEPGSPVAFEIETLTGDPTAKAASGIDPWSTEEAIADVMGWIKASGYDPDVIAEIERMIPGEVFQQLKLPSTGSN